ncbi:adhesion G-protein coupled receptor G7-like isoform X1 [Branchiostoma floridae x Branchiostoma belcheri]
MDRLPLACRVTLTHFSWILVLLLLFNGDGVSAQDTDDCRGVICQNGGICVDGVNSYSCNCAPGFEGLHCETNTDDCRGVICQNGGTCVDGVNSYSCNCDAGYEGLHCEIVNTTAITTQKTFQTTEDTTIQTTHFTTDKTTRGRVTTQIPTTFRTAAVDPTTVISTALTTQKTTLPTSNVPTTFSTTYLTTAITTVTTAIPTTLMKNTTTTKTPPTTCYGGTVTVIDTFVNFVNLTFPDSAGDTHAYSNETCANNTESAGIPLAVRRCVGSVETGVSWASPELLDCGLDLSTLAQVAVTAENAAEVASDLQILTSAGSSLMAENIADASTVLESLANTTGDENVGYSLVVSVDQIMNSDDDVLYQSQANNQSLSRIVRAIEQFNDRVNLTSNRFRRIEKNIGVETYQIEASELVNSVGFALLDGSEDLEDGLVRSYSDSSSIPTDQVDASIVLPAADILKKSIPDTGDMQVRLSFIVYGNSRLFQSNQTSAGTRTRVNSRVIASRVTGFEFKNLSSPVVTRYIPLVQNGTNTTVKNVRCVYWDFTAAGGTGAWSSEGCAFAGIDNGRAVCHCNHLTNFAVLMDIYGGLQSFVLDLISTIGIALSITGLSLTLLSYLIFKQLRQTRPQHILANLCIALLATLILFLAGIDATHSPVGCTVVAFLLHYFLLAAFMWMAVEAFNMYLAFVIVLGAHVSRLILKAAVFAWGLPLIIAIATLVVDVPTTYPYGQETYRSTDICWLQGNQLYYGFLLPAGLVLLFNVIVYIVVIGKLACGGRTDGRVADPESGATRQNLRIAIAVMVLVGLTWVFGFFMISDGRTVFSYLFCIFNSLQGFFIFIFHCLRQKEVQNLWFKYCSCCAGDPQTTTKSSTGKSTSNPSESNSESSSREQQNGNASMDVYME